MTKLQLYTFIRNFVDGKIASDITGIDDHSYDAVIDIFSEEIKKIDNEDFIIILLNPFIPDTYRTNGTKEKLFTKLIEVLFSDWCRRMGFENKIIKQKSNIEDVRFYFGDKAILTDSKTFRLGRSQKAPNHKDFLKLSSVDHWINNHNNEENNNGKTAIGGLIVYTNQHEWEKGSEVYVMCSDKKTPTLMLPYTYLSLFLERKDTYNKEDLIKLWNYGKIFPTIVGTRQEYWTNINKEVLEILNIEQKELEIILKKYNDIIKDFIIFTIDFLNKEKTEIKEKIAKEIENINDVQSLKKELVRYKVITETISIDKIIENILSFR